MQSLNKSGVFNLQTNTDDKKAVMSNVGKQRGETSTLANILGGCESCRSLSREQISDYSSKLSVRFALRPSSRTVENRPWRHTRL